MSTAATGASLPAMRSVSIGVASAVAFLLGVLAGYLLGYTDPDRDRFTPEAHTPAKASTLGSVVGS